jgi:thiamine pyrophosphate-dependent acetolactate synthase large subunit-like protein
MWQCYEPRTLLQSTGLCTMGCALPLAMERDKATLIACPIGSRTYDGSF